ncbi:MAG: hypothetical protein H7Z37_11765 [Pyrinomonadaceae bacterium]|nr:hypothetical protein [Pyrinomonadaceae bacterium]
MNYAVLRENVPFKANDEKSIHVQINYTHNLGYTWIDCGISKVNNLLTALGFSTPQEVSALCAEKNILALFAEESWVRSYQSETEKQLIFGEPLRDVKRFVPNFSFAKTVDIKLGVQNPSYNDFFQMLFTWLTHGNNAELRKQFIEWWSFENGIVTDEKFAVVGNKNPLYPNKIIQTTSPVLITFKDEVTAFLSKGKNNGKTDVVPGSGSPFVDVVHWIEKTVIGLFLRESGWKYVSGDDLSVAAEVPFVGAGVTGGAGYYYFYSNNAPNEFYPLRFGQLAVSAGPNLIPSPVGVGVNLSFLPAAGTLYQAWSGVSTPRDLNGIYLYISGTAGLIANINTSLIFFLPIGQRIPKDINEVLADGASQIAVSLVGIAASKAVMAVAGHGFESTLGAGAALGFGYVHVGSPVKSEDLHWKKFLK